MAWQQFAEAKREEFGNLKLEFDGANCVAGLFAGHFAGLRPASFSPARSSAKESELHA